MERKGKGKENIELGEGNGIYKENKDGGDIRLWQNDKKKIDKEGKLGRKMEKGINQGK